MHKYEWYFGRNVAPESKAEAIAHIALGIGGCCVMLVTLFVLVVRWWLCV